MGTRLTQLQTTFASGELDPALRGQRDLKAYAQGAKRARQVQRRSTGGLERRPGTLDLAALALEARLQEFEFSEDQRYVIAFENAKLEIFDTDGTLLQTITSCPWTLAQAYELSTSQLGDVMVITHVGFWMVVLRRTSATTFTLTDLTFEVSSNGNFIYQPYYKFVEPEVTLTPSAATGSINLVAKKGGVNYNLFVAGHVGERFRIYDCEVEITAITNAYTAVATVKGTLEGKLDLDPFKTTKGSNVVEVLHLYHGLESGASVPLSGANSCGGVPADEFNGTFSITVLDEHRYTITLTTVSYNYTEDLDGNGTPETTAYTAPRISEDGGGPSVKFGVAGVPTRRWGEPSFSAVRGYAGACCFHQGRLWLGGSESQPDAEWGSNALQPFRFDSGKGYDADSVQVAGGSEDISRVRHLVSNGDLQIFTPTSELAFIVREGEPITPNNARIEGFTNAGCNSAQPMEYDGATLFIQENGRTVFEWAISSTNGKYAATAISTLAAHLLDAPHQIAVTPGTSSRAEQFAFFVNEDGTVAVFHSMRAENIAGWVHWTLGGGAVVNSMCCVGPHVFFSVTRGASQRLYKLAQEDIASLDGCVVHSGAASASWTLDARVRNRTVAICSELGYHGEFAIGAGGALTLPVAVETVVAGDAYYAEVETLPPSLQLANGDRAGMIKKRVRSIIDFDNAYGVTIDGVPIVTLDAGDDWAGPIRAVTGPYEMYHLGFERDPTITLGQNAPLPWRVLSVLQEVAV